MIVRSASRKNLVNFEREYDLTEATRDRIQAPSTGTIWTAPLP